MRPSRMTTVPFAMTLPGETTMRAFTSAYAEAGTATSCEVMEGAETSSARHADTNVFRTMSQRLF